MESVKRPVAGLIRPSRSENAKGNNSDINELKEAKLREEKSRTLRLKEDEDRDIALQLVNEFIENETRSSFKRKAERRVIEEKLKFRLNSRETHEASSKIIVNEFIENETRSSFEIKAKRRAEEEKLKFRLSRMDTNKAFPKTNLKSKITSKDKWEERIENSPYAEGQTINVRTTKLNPKHIKRNNKVKPSVPEAVQTSSPQFTRRNDVESKSPNDENEAIAQNSCMTIVMMALSLEGEYPAEFYQKLMESETFKNALKYLSDEQKSLILAMMGDITEPLVDYLPIQQNESFVDNFKGYKLSFST